MLWFYQCFTDPKDHCWTKYSYLPCVILPIRKQKLILYKTRKPTTYHSRRPVLLKLGVAFNIDFLNNDIKLLCNISLQEFWLTDSGLMRGGFFLIRKSKFSSKKN